MDRAKEIFNKIKENKEAAIDDFIANREYENLFLDFKRVATKNSPRKLEPSDRKNYGKAISGFGNSEGGVIVWGVDCSSKNNGDVATEKCPIDNPKNFASLLEGSTSGCTLPPHDGVHNEVISSDDSTSGYVVTYISKSERAPHQALVEDKNYCFIRAGSTFEPAPYGVLAGMFGRRPQPKLSFSFISNLPEKGVNESSIKFSFKLTVENLGPSLAHMLYLSLKINPKPRNIQISYDVPDHFKLIKSVNDSCASIISNEGVYLPPSGLIHPVNFNIEYFGDIDDDLSIEGTLGSENTVPILFRIYNDKKSLNSLHEDLVQNYHTYSEENLKEKAKLFFKTEIQRC